MVSLQSSRRLITYPFCGLLRDHTCILSPGIVSQYMYQQTTDKITNYKKSD